MPDMQKVLQIKERILQVIKEKGPELPVRVASAIGGNNLFTAAFMSELVGEQKLRISNLRVGGSPLYYMAGQEEQLQKYIDFLNHKEKEAFKLLKQSEILEDSEQEPAIRVALRNIKDFAIQIKIIENNQEKLFWKIHTLSNDKAKEMIEKIINPQKQEIKEEIKQETIKEKTEEVKEENPEINKIEKQIIQKEKKSTEINSDFLDNLKNELKEKQYEISKEIIKKKKEFVAKIKTKTHLGEQEFYLVAKDKKKITLEDIVSTLQKSQAEKMPAIIMSQGDIDKKALEYYKEWSNLIKHQKISI